MLRIQDMTAPQRTFLFLLLAGSAFAVMRAQNTPSAPKEGTVTQLDGTKFFGLIEVTDDYTVRVSTDTGIQKLPIASLDQADFLSYSGQNDRSQDGRLWSERQDSLEEASQENKDPKKSAEFEIRLAELAPFQPVIAAYEKLAPPKEEKTAEGTNQKSTSPSSTLQMFSGPGSLQVPSAPFGQGLGQEALAPATSVGAGAAEAAAGAAQSVLPK